MNESEWRQVEEIFDHIVDKSPSHRSDYLDMVCEDLPEIRLEVERLLVASDALEKEGSLAETFLKAATGPPGQLGRYVLGEMLGHGGMGEVYRAQHEHYGEVALKLLPVFFVQDPSARTRFENEARVLGELEHSSLCRLYEYFVTEDYACIAMECVDGTELSDRLLKGPLSFDDALDIVSMLTAALAVAHASGVTHRDIKPANVILTEDGTAKLIDFGVAKFADLRLTATGQAIGSPRYMSPEQWLGNPVDGRTDLWSLGVLWYEMLAGRKPFDGESAVDIAAEVLGSAAAPLPEESIDGRPLMFVSVIIDALLSKDPKERIRSCDELATSLRRAGR